MHVLKCMQKSSIAARADVQGWRETTSHIAFCGYFLTGDNLSSISGSLYFKDMSRDYSSSISLLLWEIMDDSLNYYMQLQITFHKRNMVIFVSSCFTLHLFYLTIFQKNEKLLFV